MTLTSMSINDNLLGMIEDQKDAGDGFSRENQSTEYRGDAGIVSGWTTITQAQIDLFSAATLDDDPMHVDAIWAKDVGPFGVTVAFGFLTLSLFTFFSRHSAMASRLGIDASKGYGLNYGFDRIRFLAPVPVGSRLRAHFKHIETRADAPDRTLFRFGVTVELDGSTRAACVAEWLWLWVDSLP